MASYGNYLIYLKKIKTLFEKKKNAENNIVPVESFANPNVTPTTILFQVQPCLYSWKARVPGEVQGIFHLW